MLKKRMPGDILLAVSLTSPMLLNAIAYKLAFKNLKENKNAPVIRNKAPVVRLDKKFPPK